ncbi:CLUMA_CG001410, isoform A [Clunio marinus]|uniref:CLUMA_CG001410, isoform A n=1 Tax=Clunio marinus TaxID=568069 RepID=A0A1J1HMD2_9DIPT|nr:CLUMA_CG001410, isoform A [Clunio marinus]
MLTNCGNLLPQRIDFLTEISPKVKESKHRQLYCLQIILNIKTCDVGKMQFVMLSIMSMACCDVTTEVKLLFRLVECREESINAHDMIKYLVKGIAVHQKEEPLSRTSPTAKMKSLLLLPF